MAQSQNVIKNESHVAPYEGAGAIETAYKKKMMRSVVFIDTISDDGKGSGLIVGLPRSQPMLMTCHHVIPSKEVARKSTISFDREDSSSPGVPVSGAELFDLDSEDSFVTSDTQDMDYTIIGLNPDKIPQDDGKREPFYLHKYQRTLTGEYSLRKGNNVYLIHYPHIDGTFYRQESAFVIQFLSGYLFGHRAETHGGSSGCPVLKEHNKEWVLAGLHRGQKPKDCPGTEVNFATHVEAIHRTLTDPNYNPEAPDWEFIERESTAGSVKDSKKEDVAQPSSERDIPDKEETTPKHFDSVQFMERYPSFPKEVAAKAIYMQLQNKNVIGEDVAYEIKQTYPGNAGQLLYAHLKSNATLEDIRTLCAVMVDVGKGGYKKMMFLGEKMLKDKDLN
jgi:V8-like Glu-specific endopeptidase